MADETPLLSKAVVKTTTPFPNLPRLNSDEEWREVVGFEAYWVSNFGRVFSAKSSKILRPGRTGRGDLADGGFYLGVVLRRGNSSFPRKIHRLVAEAFLVPPPFDDAQVRHLNGCSVDNRSANLSWGTAQQNAADRRTHGHERAAKIDSKIARIIRAEVANGTSRARLAELYNLSISQIGRIVTGIQWNAGVEQ